MTARETWVQRDPITQQVIRDGEGNPITDSGNVCVDFVWGNYAMQPNDDRNDGWDQIVAPNAAQNRGWSGYSVYYSDNLKNDDYNVNIGNIYGEVDLAVRADSHVNNSLKWNAFPEYTPMVGISASGTTTVPDFVGLTVEAAAELALLNGLRIDGFTETESGTEAPGFVYAQDVASGDTVTKGTPVSLSIYKIKNGANAGVKYNTAAAPWVYGTVAG